jgi:hypothetical protein
MKRLRRANTFKSDALNKNKVNNDCTASVAMFEVTMAIQGFQKVKASIM